MTEVECNLKAPGRARMSGAHSRRALILALALASAASAGPVAAGGQSRVNHAVARVRHLFQIGQASWYGRAVQGQKTASGERFDMNGMTCAHRTLPLGSWLRVTNLSNRQSVLVRVTDRGPISRARVIDLSYAAAHAVGIGGVARVQLEALDPSDPLVAATIASNPAAEMRSFAVRVR